MLVRLCCLLPRDLVRLAPLLDVVEKPHLAAHQRCHRFRKFSSEGEMADLLVADTQLSRVTAVLQRLQTPQKRRRTAMPPIVIRWSPLCLRQQRPGSPPGSRSAVARARHQVECSGSTSARWLDRCCQTCLDVIRANVLHGRFRTRTQRWFYEYQSAELTAEKREPLPSDPQHRSSPLRDDTCG